MPNGSTSRTSTLRRMPRVKKVGADFPNQSNALLAEALRASERAEEESRD